MRILDERSEPIVMGIINVTPDSFSDGGWFYDPKAAVEHGKRLLGEGARILDIGGESTRPGATPIDSEEEIKRILPVLDGLKPLVEEHDALLSVDTRHAKTMEAVLEAGVGMVNDVTALTWDMESLQLVAKYPVYVVLMHMLGTPRDMQAAPQYGDVVEEVFSYLESRIKACELAGISRDKIIVDPGIGFGKTAHHNIQLLSSVHRFCQLDVPVLLGVSRKSFIASYSNGEPPTGRLGGSIAAGLVACEQGASILRVHDVKETVQALKIQQAIFETEILDEEATEFASVIR